MPLLTVVLALVVVGVALWALLTYVPMARPFPQIISAVVVVVTLLWLAQVFGLIAPLQSIRVR